MLSQKQATAAVYGPSVTYYWAMYECIYVGICMCVCMYVCMQACMYACIYVCVHVYTYIYICMQVCVYMYILCIQGLSLWTESPSCILRLARGALHLSTKGSESATSRLLS